MERLNWLKARLGQGEADRESPIATAARARGWDWLGDVDHETLGELGLDFEFGADDVARAPGQPLVVCGSNGRTNHGDRIGGVLARNFVAVRHGLDLPRLRTHSRERPPTHTGLTKAAVNVTKAAFVVTAVADLSSPFGGGHKDIKLPRRTNFEVQCARETRPAVQALMSADAVGILRWLSSGFDVETSDGWLIAWAGAYDLVTEDPRVWAWLEAAGSGLIDLARVWGAGAGFGRDWPSYTATRGPRPDSLVPSPAFLRPQRSRLD